MKTIPVEGGSLAYWEAGSGPALVVIHGTGTPGELWRADLMELDRIARVITYDRRGYGKSSESPRSWTAHRDDATALIDELGATPALIVGYSGGAIPALDLAVDRPDLVVGLVLIDPVVHGRSNPVPGLGRALLKVRLLRRLRGERAAAEAWIRYISSYSTGGAAWDKAVPGRRETILASASGILADIETGEGEHLTAERLAAIEVPITIVEAALGPEIFRRSAQRLREMLPSARSVTLEKSSHIVMLDAREEVLDVLRRAVTEPARIERRSSSPP